MFGFDDAVGLRAAEGEADDCSYAGAWEGKASGRGREVVDALEDDGVGCDQDVEEAVHDGYVDAHCCCDGREEEHLHGAHDGVFDKCGWGEVRSELGAVSWVAGLFSETGGLAFEEDD